MERFWTLKHLEQAGITELTATLFKDNLVRADTLPLVLPVLGADGLPRGAHVRVRLGAIDEITLDVSGTVIERLDAPVRQRARTSDGGRRRRRLATCCRWRWRSTSTNADGRQHRRRRASRQRD